MRSLFLIKHITVLTLVTLLAACGAGQADQQASIPTLPSVSVAEVVVERVTEWDEFTGRIQAPQTIELRPRVSGYIDIVGYEEGAIVEAGQPLFFIDNRPYRAEVKRLEAELAQANSQRQLAEREYTRASNLIAESAISQEMLDSRLAASQQAAAHVQSVEAALEIARLNLSYTRVEAPIRGRVSNALITKGNYVTAGVDVLTTLVSTDKVYAYFDADEQTYLKYVEMANQGERPSSRDVRNPVVMGLANDIDYPHHGVIDFVDNTVNQQTGTIRGRAVFDNADGKLIPGLFARIKLVGSASYDGILIDDKAIGTDLNNKYVLVLDEQNTVQYRPVELGEKISGLRIIKSGLQHGEKIVVRGLQRVRPGTPVQPTQVDMADWQRLADLQAQQRRVDRIREEVQLAQRGQATGTTATIGG